MKIKVHFSTFKRFNLFSVLIRFIEKSKFSHTSIEFNIGKRSFIAHATEYRVNIISAHKFYRENEIFHIIEFDLNDIQFEKFKNLIYDTLGISYSWKTIIGIVLSRFLSLIGIKNRKFFEDKNKTMFCSEYVWYILSNLGYKIENFDPELDGPKKLYEILKASKCIEE